MIPGHASQRIAALNHANQENPDFGRVGDETVSGHWLYAFLRHDPKSGQSFMIVANFHGSETLRNVRISIPQNAWEFMNRTDRDDWTFTNQLDREWTGQTVDQCLNLPDLPPCDAMILEIR